MEYSIGDIIQALFLLGAVVTVYVKQQIKNKELDMRMKGLEGNMQKVEKHDEKIFEKLDEIKDTLHELDKKIEQKTDR